jgi:predicted transcriptional regulator
LIKWQSTIELVRGSMKSAEKVGLMVFSKVVRHVRVLSQVIRHKHTPIGIVNMHLAVNLSTCDFQLPFLL